MCSGWCSSRDDRDHAARGAQGVADIGLADRIETFGVRARIWFSESWLEADMSTLMRALLLCLVVSLIGMSTVRAADDPTAWPLLKSTFPSTGGGGMTIKGYDPVIAGSKCITTFMAVTADATPAVYSNVVEFEAVPSHGGMLCQNGKWRAFDGSASGTTPFRVFLKDGVWRGQ